MSVSRDTESLGISLHYKEWSWNIFILFILWLCYFIIFVKAKVALKGGEMECIWLHEVYKEQFKTSRIYEIIVPRVSMNPIYLKYHYPLCQELWQAE